MEGSIVGNETEQQAWVEIWGKRIKALGLSSAALSLLETIRALGFLGSQALLMTQPLVTDVANDRRLKRTMAMLDDPELLDQLRVSLEREER
jgi:hypothetical protein